MDNGNHVRNVLLVRRRGLNAWRDPLGRDAYRAILRLKIKAGIDIVNGLIATEDSFLGDVLKLGEVKALIHHKPKHQLGMMRITAIYRGFDLTIIGETTFEEFIEEDEHDEYDESIILWGEETLCENFQLFPQRGKKSQQNKEVKPKSKKPKVNRRCSSRRGSTSKK